MLGKLILERNSSERPFPIILLYKRTFPIILLYNGVLLSQLLCINKLRRLNALVLGCLVTARIRSHVRPLGFICLGDVATSSGIGSKHILLLHNPTENPV